MKSLGKGLRLPEGWKKLSFFPGKHLIQAHMNLLSGTIRCELRPLSGPSEHIRCNEGFRHNKFMVQITRQTLSESTLPDFYEYLHIPLHHLLILLAE
jgi:hypothetical protein